MTGHDNSVGKYMYCIIRTPSPCQFSILGIGEQGDRVHTLHFRDLAAVVSDSPVMEYEPSRRNMMAHSLVLEEVMRNHTVLPIRFGTVAPSADVIQEKVLSRRFGELHGYLDEMEGRIELGVRTFWYEGMIFKEILEEEASIRRLRDSLIGLPLEKTYYERIHLGEMIEKVMQKKRDEDAEKVLSYLRPLASKTCTSKVSTDRMVLNAAFLVEKTCQPDFDQAVEHLDQAMGNRFIFKYVGPVPPYNFVNILISWDEG